MSASSSEDDIEMANLEDIAVTPNPRFQNGTKHIPFDPHQQPEDSDKDSDKDSDEEDEGDVALLGLPQRTHGRERIQVHMPQGWSQAKGIVIEVSLRIIFIFQRR
jgi:solute carrier family 41